MKYTYALNQMDVQEDCCFRDYEFVTEHPDLFHPKSYHTVAFGTIEGSKPETACENLYKRYNRRSNPSLPEDYPGRSMSVSDIVDLWDNSVDPPVKSSWYCDSIGFKKMEV